MGRVLLTGASGAMGSATLRELLARGIPVRALVLPGDQGALTGLAGKYGSRGDLEILVGDLRDPRIVAAAVSGVDMVLHLAALVSPNADANPALAWEVNVGGTRTLLQALALLDPPPALVAIGSVAETGDRNPPRHWGRVGDPLRPSPNDFYAQTKIEAERLVVDSGLPRWLWLRQTGILHPGLLANRDPIMTHTPLDGILEWVSEVDSARLMATIAAGHAPEEAWGRIFNIGGGDGWRVTNYEFFQLMGQALGVGDIRGWFSRNWFATQGFHGHWFSDSDELEQLIPFRSGESLPEAMARCATLAPAHARLARLLPNWLVRYFVTGPAAYRTRGTMRAISRDDRAAIRAHFGSREEWRAIGTWADYVPLQPSRQPTYLDHGYDTSLPRSRWDASVLQEVATFRGGHLEGQVGAGEYARKVHWRCAAGHRFAASPRLILEGGHWCPVCVRHPFDYESQAASNRFLAQVM